MKTLIAAIGQLIEAIGTKNFAQTLSETLKGLVPFDYTVMFGYLGNARPMDLFDDFPRGKRKIFVTDYQEGPYLLDPFYLACANHVAPDLYRIKTLAPDRFFQGEYFRSYYARTGLAEEIGYFIEMREKAIVVVSMMRAEKAFSAKEFRQLREFWPVVCATCQRHWGDLATQFGTQAQTTADGGLHQSVALAFTNFGEGVLTPREREVVEFTLKGHSADAVGRILGISPGTVRIHRRNVYSKLQINSQGELFSCFIETLVSGPTP
jgi:DNA-binding CsgD family transcriptional regulator